MKRIIFILLLLLMVSGVFGVTIFDSDGNILSTGGDTFETSASSTTPSILGTGPDVFTYQTITLNDLDSGLDDTFGQIPYGGGSYFYGPDISEDNSDDLGLFTPPPTYGGVQRDSNGDPVSPNIAVGNADRDYLIRSLPLGVTVDGTSYTKNEDGSFTRNIDNVVFNLDGNNLVPLTSVILDSPDRDYLLRAGSYDVTIYDVEYTKTGTNTFVRKSDGVVFELDGNNFMPANRVSLANSDRDYLQRSIATGVTVEGVAYDKTNDGTFIRKSDGAVFNLEGNSLVRQSTQSASSRFQVSNTGTELTYNTGSETRTIGSVNGGDYVFEVDGIRIIYDPDTETFEGSDGETYYFDYDGVLISENGIPLTSGSALADLRERTAAAGGTLSILDQARVEGTTVTQNPDGSYSIDGIEGKFDRDGNPIKPNSAIRPSAANGGSGSSSDAKGVIPGSENNANTQQQLPPPPPPQGGSTFTFFDKNGKPTNAAQTGGTVFLMSGRTSVDDTNVDRLAQYTVAKALKNEAVLVDRSGKAVIISQSGLLGGKYTVYEAVTDEKGNYKKGAKLDDQSLATALLQTQRNRDGDKYRADRGSSTCEGGFGAIAENCGWAYDLGTMSTFAAGADSLSGLFMSEESLAAWRGQVDEVFSFLEPSGWAAKMCEAKIDTPPQGTAYVKLPNGQGMAVAATIAGECAKQSSGFSDATEYLYKFVGFVKNPQVGIEETNIRFQLKVSGPSGTVDLLNETRTLEPGQSFSMQNRNTFVQLSENAYDTICVHFENPPEFYDSNTVCNRIVCNEVDSTRYDSPPLDDLPDVDPVPSGTTGQANAGSSGGFNII